MSAASAVRPHEPRPAGRRWVLGLLTILAAHLAPDSIAAADSVSVELSGPVRVRTSDGIKTYDAKALARVCSKGNQTACRYLFGAACKGGQRSACRRLEAYEKGGKASRRQDAATDGPKRPSGTSGSRENGRPASRPAPTPGRGAAPRVQMPGPPQMPGRPPALPGRPRY